MGHGTSRDEAGIFSIPGRTLSPLLRILGEPEGGSIHLSYAQILMVAFFFFAPPLEFPKNTDFRNLMC